MPPRIAIDASASRHVGGAPSHAIPGQRGVDVAPWKQPLERVISGGDITVEARGGVVLRLHA